MRGRFFFFLLAPPLVILALISYSLLVSGSFFFNVTFLTLNTAVFVGLILGIRRKARQRAMLAIRIPVPTTDALFQRADALRQRMLLDRAELYFVEGSKSEKMVARALFGRRPSILISTRLLEELSPEEQDSILAHEMAHVKNWDLIRGFLLHISYVVAGIDLFLFSGSRVFQTDASEFALLGILLVAAGTLFVIPFAGRRLELNADLIAVQTLGKEPMLSALTKLDAKYGPRMKPGRLRKLMLSTPPTVERLQRIRNSELTSGSNLS